MSNTVAVKLALEGGTVVSDGVNRVSTSLDALGKQVNVAASGSDRLSGAIGRVAHYGLAGGALYGLANTMQNVKDALFEASVSAQRMQIQLNFATAGNAAKELAFVSGLANRLGLELNGTAQAYAGFASAARGTAMEGKATRDVFEAVAKANAVMGLTADQSRGSLLAIQQMMSKGVVNAEEFRGQLGERMPIALQAGALAVGKTTAEFSKMMETGQIVSQDFLPKFAAAINEMIGESVASAANRLDASVSRMANAWQQLKRTVGDAGVSQAVANEASGLANYMNQLTDAMENAKHSGSGLANVLLTGLGTALARMPFDALAGASNLLNGTINALSGNVFKLNTSLSLLPEAFMSNAQKSERLAANLANAQTSLQALQTQLARQPNDIYLKSEAHAAWLLVQQLQAAKKAKDDLASGGAGRGSVNPQTVEQMMAAQNRLNAAMEQYASKTEKANKTVKDLREAHGALFTPALEAKVRASIDGDGNKRNATVLYYEQLQAMVSEGEKSVLDTLQKEHAAGLLGESAYLQAKYNQQADANTDMQALVELEMDAVKKSALAPKDKLAALDKYNQELAKLQAQERGLTRAHETDLEVLAKKSADERIKIRRHEAGEIGKYFASQEDAQHKALASLDERIQSLGEEMQAVDLSASANISLAQAVQRLTIARLEAEQAEKFVAGSQGWDDMQERINKQRELLALIEGKDVKEQWRQTSTFIKDGLTNAFMDSVQTGKSLFLSLRDAVVGMFNSMVLRPIVSAVMNPIAQGLTGMMGLGGAANAGTSLGGVGNMMVGSSLAGGLEGMITSVGASMMNGPFSAVLGDIGASLAANSAMLATAIPYIGLAVAAIVAISKATSGEMRSGGQYGYSFNGADVTNNRRGTMVQSGGVGATFLEGPSGGDFMGSQVQAGINATVSGINATLASFGSKAVLMGFQAGYETSGDNRGGVMAGGTLSNGKTFGQSGAGNNYDGTLYDPSKGFNMDAKQAGEAFGLELQQSVIEALQASDLPEYLRRVFDGLDATKMSAADVNKTLAYASTLKTVREALTETREPMQILRDTVAAGMADLGTSAATFKTDFVAAIDAGLTPDKLAKWQTLGGALEQASAGVATFVSTVQGLVTGISASVKDSVFGMQYGLADNQGKYAMLDAQAKQFDDQMKAATDINQIAKYAQSEIDTINKAWALLDPTQQAGALKQNELLLAKIDSYVIGKGADAISLKKAENKDLSDAVASAVEKALKSLAEKLTAAALAQADLASKVVNVASKPAQVTVTVNNSTGSEVSVSQ